MLFLNNKNENLVDFNMDLVERKLFFACIFKKYIIALLFLKKHN